MIVIVTNFSVEFSLEISVLKFQKLAPPPVLYVRYTRCQSQLTSHHFKGRVCIFVGTFSYRGLNGLIEVLAEDKQSPNLHSYTKTKRIVWYNYCLMYEQSVLGLLYHLKMYKFELFSN